jgi:hypothetical protein
MPITVAARSKAHYVFDRWIIGIEGTSLTRSTKVCGCVGRDLAIGTSTGQKTLSNV